MFSGLHSSHFFICLIQTAELTPLSQCKENTEDEVTKNIEICGI